MPKVVPNYTTVPGQGFTVLDLDLGEIALNISDGTLYLKKETAGVPSVIILAGSGSSVVSSSYADYANQAIFATSSINSTFATIAFKSYYSNTALSASFADRANYSDLATVAFKADNADSASYVANALYTASAAGSTITFTKGDNSTFNVTVTTATAETASYVTSSNVDGPFGKNSILSSSFSATSSLPLRGLITASAAGSTITFTKGDSSTFNVTVTTATAETASYVTSSNVDGPFGKNSILSSSFSVTASYVLNAISASFVISASQAVTASYVLNAVSSSFATSASQAVTSSFSLNTVSSSYAVSSSNIEGGTTNYLPLWRTNTALTSSIIYQSGSNIAIGGGAILPSAKLEIRGTGSTSATATLNALNSSLTSLLYLRDDGFVGIGTSSAVSTENVLFRKQSTLFDQGTNTVFTVVDVSNTTDVLRLGVESNSGGALATNTTAFAGIVGTTKSYPLQFITNNTVKATLLSNGNIGISNTSPSYTLDVSGSARITSPSVLLPGLINSSQPNFVGFDSVTGQLYYAATNSFAAATASFITASNVWGPFGSNSVLSSSYALSSSTALTASFIATASWALNALTASYISASNVAGLNLFQITTGSITASVNVDPTNLFLIRSGSTRYFNISSSGNVDVFSNLFIIRNFTTQQPVLTVSQSIVQIATQSAVLTNVVPAGSIYFTSNSFYVGLD